MLRCSVMLLSLAICAVSPAAPGVPVSPLMADNQVAGLPGRTAWQFPAGSVAPSGFTLAGQSYPVADFPTFVVLTPEGKQVRLAASDAAWRTTMTTEREARRVQYAANGLRVRLSYLADRDRLHVVAAVLAEGDYKLIAIDGTPLGPVLWPNEAPNYLIDGSGWLVKPRPPKKLERRWDANSDNMIGGATTAGFISLREPDRIVTVKPLTFSHWLGWTATPGDTMTTVAIQAGLYFRPPDTINPQTKLCHQALALRLETCGDVNQDRAVDWVDAGIAYRQRYLKPHVKPCRRVRLRDAFRVYHQVHAGYPNMAAATRGLDQIDFADGIWWCKGLMKFADEKDSESHPYTVARREGFSDLAQVKLQMDKAGQWMGLYYGHDYISLLQGDWPDEFIKRDPQGNPQKYYSNKYYKDNVRSVASGAVFRHYDEIIQACDLHPGDPIMLDTFTAFARPGYHPDFPATAELETQAKHDIARYLHDQGLIVAGEGIIEGTQDVVDYGAYAMRAYEFDWRAKDGVQHVPMLPVVFQGASYYGSGWYEFRQPTPNWAIGLTYGVGYWDWNPQGNDFAWRRYARYYFNQNLPWAMVADATVTDMAIDGPRYTVSYSNGAKLEADMAANRWVLEIRGVRYDGFTPFNARGYMAVLARDRADDSARYEFDTIIPGEHRLEISPHQPLRDQISFECSAANGQTRLRGKFGHLKWNVPILTTTPEGKEVVQPNDVDPVLVLRKAK